MLPNIPWLKTLKSKPAKCPLTFHDSFYKIPKVWFIRAAQIDDGRVIPEGFAQD